MLVKKIFDRDNVTDLWRYYDENEPFNVNLIGLTDCSSDKDGKCRVERQDFRVWVLEYVREGSGRFEINGKTYRPEAGSVMVLAKGSDHVYYPDNDGVWKRDWVAVNGPFADALFRSYLPEGEYCFGDCDLSAFFEKLRALADKKPFDYHAFLDGAAPLFCEALASVKEANRRKINRIALAVKSALDENVEDTVTIEDIAQSLKISSNYVIRQFKEQYGCTPYKYYTDRKLKLAQLYLRNTDMSIAEISERLHFADQHYFSNAFRQHSGMCASDYRKKYAPIIVGEKF